MDPARASIVSVECRWFGVFSNAETHRSPGREGREFEEPALRTVAYAVDGLLLDKAELTVAENGVPLDLSWPETGFADLEVTVTGVDAEVGLGYLTLLRTDKTRPRNQQDRIFRPVALLRPAPTAAGDPGASVHRTVPR